MGSSYMLSLTVGEASGHPSKPQAWTIQATPSRHSRAGDCLLLRSSARHKASTGSGRASTWLRLGFALPFLRLGLGCASALLRLALAVPWLCLGFAWALPAADRRLIIGRKASLAGPVLRRAGIREAGSGPGLKVMTTMASFVGTLRAPLSARGPGPRKSLTSAVPKDIGTRSAGRGFPAPIVDIPCA